MNQLELEESGTLNEAKSTLNNGKYSIELDQEQIGKAFFIVSQDQMASKQFLKMVFDAQSGDN